MIFFRTSQAPLLGGRRSPFTVHPCLILGIPTATHIFTTLLVIEESQTRGPITWPVMTRIVGPSLVPTAVGSVRTVRVQRSSACSPTSFSPSTMHAPPVADRTCVEILSTESLIVSPRRPENCVYNESTFLGDRCCAARCSSLMQLEVTEPVSVPLLPSLVPYDMQDGLIIVSLTSSIIWSLARRGCRTSGRGWRRSAEAHRAEAISDLPIVDFRRPINDLIL